MPSNSAFASVKDRITERHRQGVVDWINELVAKSGAAAALGKP